MSTSSPSGQDVGTHMDAIEAHDHLMDALRAARHQVHSVGGQDETVAEMRWVINRAPRLPVLRARVRTIRRQVLDSIGDVTGSDRAALIEVDDALRDALHRTRQPLRCPDCGGVVRANLATEGSPYMTYEVVDGFECDNPDCGAEWDSGDGAPTASPWS